ncbi:MAG TPA: ribonuclease E inhibitor RraB [Pyrinomonadaceae bacterium]|jgi:hypothetical protein
MDFTDKESQLEDIREIFETARTENGWNLDEEMLYSFYFIDESIEKLEKLGQLLEQGRFDFIEIFELADEKTKESTGEHLLQIDKVEIHTPESLAERNVEFQKLAEEYEVGYDGYEFGEVGDEEEDEDEEF